MASLVHHTALLTRMSLLNMRPTLCLSRTAACAPSRTQPRAQPRVRSHCRFRNRVTEYITEPYPIWYEVDEWQHKATMRPSPSPAEADELAEEEAERGQLPGVRGHLTAAV